VPDPLIAGAPAERLARLRAVPEAAPVLAALEGEERVHLVGGAVRDLLLGRTPCELDLVVEGDALSVAGRAAARLGGAVVAHPRFGTATVRADGVAFDLAGSRAERYARPGALPDVRLGAPLEEDLARRDFTVNAIAMRLADGKLTACPGALEDLAAGRLRVLHDRSFEDDPTRLIRLARYAARLGFAAEERTARLAADAVAAGAFETVTGERLGAELRLLVLEPQPAALGTLADLGAGRALLGPAFRVRDELVASALAHAPPDARPDLVALAAALAGAKRAPLAARLRELAFPAAEAAVVVAAATVERLRPALAAAGRPSAVDLALRREPPEAAALAAALGLGHPGAIARWLAEDRHKRLAITGDDLLAAGLRGPAVGAGLAAARAAMLDGKAATPDEQLAAALAAVAG
jgi:tRNA nucleotidyltransferase (CCA-adding enzyme)